MKRLGKTYQRFQFSKFKNSQVSRKRKTTLALKESKLQIIFGVDFEIRCTMEGHSVALSEIVFLQKIVTQRKNFNFYAIFNVKQDSKRQGPTTESAGVILIMSQLTKPSQWSVDSPKNNVKSSSRNARFSQHIYLRLNPPVRACRWSFVWRLNLKD